MVPVAYDKYSAKSPGKAADNCDTMVACPQCPYGHEQEMKANMSERVLPRPAPTYDPQRVNSVRRMQPDEVVHELVALLGARLTAVIGDVSDTRHVRAWENKEQTPQRFDALKAALQAARVISDAEGRDAARGWFAGCNAHFEFRSPADVLLENTPESRTAVVAAAHAEVSG
jgi:hypothetical protein